MLFNVIVHCVLSRCCFITAWTFVETIFGFCVSKWHNKRVLADGTLQGYGFAASILSGSLLLLKQEQKQEQAPKAFTVFLGRMPSPIVILTLAIGADYKKALAPALKSKRDYAAAHGYEYVQGGEEFWDRMRPIAWSKIGFVLSELEKRPDGTLLWLSDADVLVTNKEIRLEDHMVPMLPEV